MKTIASLLGYVLNVIYNVVGNYGLAIIIFTIAIKLLILPFSIKQQKTMKKSQEMQGKVKELQDKYKNDQARLATELQDLYKRENMSPFSGCLTSILQMFLILGMFYMVSSPLTYMLHMDTAKIDEYKNKILEARQVDNIAYIEIAIIKEYGSIDNEINLNMDFLGLDLSDIPSQNYGNFKVYIIPALYVITSIISTKLTMSVANKTKEKENADKNKVVAVYDENKELVKNANKEEKEGVDKEDDMMSEMNSQMAIMMPVMSVMIAMVAPLGLALYWLISNLFMMFERIVVNQITKKGETANGER